MSQDLELLSTVITFMSYKKSNKIKGLAYAIVINFLAEEEIRRAIMRDKEVDVMARLISILQYNSPEDMHNSPEEVAGALKALSNCI